MLAKLTISDFSDAPSSLHMVASEIMSVTPESLGSVVNRPENAMPNPAH